MTCTCKVGSAPTSAVSGSREQQGGHCGPAPHQHCVALKGPSSRHSVTAGDCACHSFCLWV